MNNIEVALAKELCPICYKKMDGPILINSLLTEKAAQEVKNLHGKVIGISPDACEECSKYKDSALFLISIDPKTLDRTGQVVGIKINSNFAKNIPEEFIQITNNGVKYAFIEYECGKEVGLWE